MSWRDAAAVAVLIVCIATIDAAAPLEARLAGGRAVLDRFGDVINYVIFAEERAVVSPAPQFEVWQGGRKRSLVEEIIRVPRVRHPMRVRHRKNTSISVTFTDTRIDPNQRTETVHVERFSYMSWFTLSTPRGAGSPHGTGRVQAAAQSAFVLRDLVFPLAGRYNLGFNATLYTGEKLRFNHTVIVDKQPQEVRLSTFPVGYNGTAMSPAPSAQLTDWLGNTIRTSTALIQLSVLSGPQGFELLGATRLQTTSDGTARFADAIPTLPGRYVFQFDALLSDKSVLNSVAFTVDIQKALPQRIVVLQNTFGIAGFRFFNQPAFSIRDAKGPSHDPRTNITVSLGLNLPSIRYEGLNTVGVLTGTTTAMPVNYTYAFTDLVIDLPGAYELNVVLGLDGDPYLVTTVRLSILDQPTFEATALQVNTIGSITIYGDRPDTDPVYLKLSVDERCLTTISDPVYWRRPANSDKVRNISFVPYGSGDAVYVCMKLPTQTDYVPLVQNYVPRSNELYPRILTFAITTVSECQPLTSIQAYQYKLVGWESATSGRRYGCRLTPPASGTIPPCECPAILSCEGFRHRLFTPPNLDIGQCVCCKQSIMVAAGTVTAVFLATLLAVIYHFV